MRLALIAALGVSSIMLAAVAQQQQDAPPHALQPPSPSAAKVQRPPQHKGGATQQAASPEQHGSEERPLIVKVLPTEKTEDERAQETADRTDKSSADWWLVRLTGALAGVGILQFLALIGQAIVFRVQANALRESVDLTREVAGRQERDMQASITEAGRSAGAMEHVADGIAKMADDQREFWKLQMRPYIALVDPGFIPQNRATPYFAEAQLTMINTGHTPAHNIRFAAYLKVLPVVLPEDFDFAIRPNEIIVSGHINPGQRLFFRRNVGGLLGDDEYDAIIQGRSMQRIYLYGTIFFDDAFGDAHYTEFLFLWHVGHYRPLLDHKYSPAQRCHTASMLAGCPRVARFLAYISTCVVPATMLQSRRGGACYIMAFIITIIARPIVMVGFVAGVFVSFALRDLPIGRELDRIIERLHVIHPRG
jgi:hypothetical protein